MATSTSHRRLLHVFPSFALGGSQARLVKLIDAFGDRYRHRIVSINGDESARSVIGRSDLVDFIACPKADGALGRLKAYRRLIRESDADLLLTYNWGAIEFAMADVPRMVRHVQVEDGFGPEETQQRLWRRSMTRRATLMANGSTMVLPSRTLQQIALSEWRLNPERVKYIPNGIDPDRHRDVAGRDRPSCHARSAQEVVIGTLAGLRPEKTLEVMIDAVAALRDQWPVRLVIAGAGPLEAALRQYCEQGGHDAFVSLLGFRSEPDEVTFELDIFCLSSLTEQLPISMIEAMFAGLPIAATDVGDIRQSLPEAQHPYLARHSAVDLARVLQPLVASASLRRELGQANRACARQRFSLEPMLRGWAEVFDQR
ncbi:MAG: glycosyltransferase family 4 protein [Burkholderiaceae bacterium]